MLMQRSGFLEYPNNPFIIKRELPAPQDSAGSLIVADVVRDWREELIVLAGNELHIYQNTAPNPNPNRPRLWTNPVYRRTKAVWNYYSP